jgi:hypothetical protein
MKKMIILGALVASVALVATINTAQAGHTDQSVSTHDDVPMRTAYYGHGYGQGYGHGNGHYGNQGCYGGSCYRSGRSCGTYGYGGGYHGGRGYGYRGYGRRGYGRRGYRGRGGYPGLYLGTRNFGFGLHY